MMDAATPHPRVEAKAMAAKKSSDDLRRSWSIPCDIPSLILPKIASGPIRKSSEAVTKPSTKGLSWDARNFFRRLSPKISSLLSSLRALPIKPPRSIVRRMTRRGEPFGRVSVKLSDHNGASAPTAPKIVIKPKISVMDFCEPLLRRWPTAIPIAEPITIAKTLISVPRPINMGPL